ncbi:MAG: NAD(P)-dependent oxidoreductase [Bacillota bacterium]|jgi:3-hydroxyisobutyrate dehydrogenase/2-hydroxy-3-oxopropionate reductase|nr:NAD(P)-dependent oxidoreductase [Bacillota bacterium]
MSKIGFIGTGVMGSAMINNLIKNNYQVNVYNRTPEKAKALTSIGAIFTSTIEECVKDVDYIITIVGMPNDVKEVYDEIFKYAKKGSIAVDMTTSSPSLAKEIFEKGKEKGIDVLDAPVSGGDIGAQKGTLSIMVGGEKEVFDKVVPIFKSMGTNINYMGKAGSGQHTKMANQIAIAGTIAAVNESIKYAKEMGLDLNEVLNAIASGAAGSWQLSNNGPKIINQDNDPGFFIKHFIKDMKIADEEALNNNLELEILQKVLKQYELLEEKGYGDLGTQAIYKYFELK